MKCLDTYNGIVPDGDYYITASIVMWNLKKINLKGNGDSSRFFVSPTYPKAKGVFVFRECQNINVEGICVDCCQDESYRGTEYSAQDGIQPFDIWNSKYVTIKNCTYKNNIYCAIRGVSTSHVLLENNKFLQVDCGFITLGQANIEDYVFRNNTFIGHQNSEPISIFGTGHAKDILIENNTFKNKLHGSGICLSQGSGENIIIRNNTFDDTACGITIEKTARGSYKNVEIYNNEIIKTFSGSGLNINGCIDAYVHDNTISYTSQHGICVKDSLNVIVANNVITNCAKKGKDMKGIFVGKGNENIVIIGNHMSKDDDSVISNLGLCFDNTDNKKVYVLESTFEGIKLAVSASSTETVLQIPDKSLKAWGYDTLTYVIKDNIGGDVIAEDDENDMKSDSKLTKDSLVVLKDFSKGVNIFLISEEKKDENSIELNNGLYAIKQY